MQPLEQLSTFLYTVFFEPDPDEVILLTTHWDDGKWTNQAALPRTVAKMEPGTRATYFCVSTVCQSDTYLRRRHQDLKVAYCVVLDDVMTKASVPPVAPTWILESSEGNYQYGYCIDPLPLTPSNVAYYEGCVRALAQAGYSDSGAGGTYRVMRVPGSLHKTGFVARITEWSPERSWDLADLMAEMGVEPLRMRVKAPRKVGVVHLADVSDPVYTWLEAQGLVLGADSPWVMVPCPWAAEHTDGADWASFSPAWYGDRGRGFNCFHGHCENRSLVDFLRWVFKEGGPDGSVAPGIPAALTKLIEDTRHAKH